MISFHSSTRSSQKALKGPEINLFNSCCDLKQQLRDRASMSGGRATAGQETSGLTRSFLLLQSRSLGCRISNVLR